MHFWPVNNRSFCTNSSVVYFFQSPGYLLQAGEGGVTGHLPSENGTLQPDILFSAENVTAAFPRRDLSPVSRTLPCRHSPESPAETTTLSIIHLKKKNLLLKFRFFYLHVHWFIYYNFLFQMIIYFFIVYHTFLPWRPSLPIWRLTLHTSANPQLTQASCLVQCQDVYTHTHTPLWSRNHKAQAGASKEIIKT